VFADYRRLLDETRPEAVIIASPNQLHAETGIECARRGIDILIEKPVTGASTCATAMPRSKDEANERKRLAPQHRIGAELGQIDRRDGYWQPRYLGIG
jgi:predicted dehydrogenase